MKQQSWIGAFSEKQQSCSCENWVGLKSGWIVGGAIATCFTLTSTALAGPLTQWKFNPQSNRLELTVKTETPPRYFIMAQPARIVVDLPDTQIKNVDRQQTYGGAVRQIRVSQFKPNQTRIVIELSPDAVLAPGQVKLERSGKQWIVRPLIVESTAAVARTAPPVAPPNPAPVVVPAVTPPSNGDPVSILPPPSVAPPSNADPAMVLPAPPEMSAELPGGGSSPMPTAAIAVAPSPTAPPLLDTALPPANFTPTPTRPTVTVPSPGQPAAVATTQPIPTTPFIMLPSSTPATPLSLPVGVPVGQPSTLETTPPPALTPQPQANSPQPMTVPPLSPNPVAAQPTSPTPTAPTMAVIQPENAGRQDPSPLPAIRIPILEFGQPLPKGSVNVPLTSTGQPATQLPPLEPGAIVLPVEGPGSSPK